MSIVLISSHVYVKSLNSGWGHYSPVLAIRICATVHCMDRVCIYIGELSAFNPFLRRGRGEVVATPPLRLLLFSWAAFAFGIRFPFGQFRD